MKASPSTGIKMQFMNLSYIAGFVICMTGTMSTAMMMILPLLILMMGILLDMIQIEVILQTAPHPPQKPLIAQQFTFASFGYFSETVPKHAELTNKATITIPEKQGDRTLFINSNQLLFTPTVPQTES